MTKEASLSGFAKWRRDIADSIYEEISAMMSGHFIPYHKLCFMAAFLTALIFSILFTQMGVIEAPVAVVDLDHSARSSSRRWTHPAISVSPRCSIRPWTRFT